MRGVIQERSQLGAKRLKGCTAKMDELYRNKGWGTEGKPSPWLERVKVGSVKRSQGY